MEEWTEVHRPIPWCISFLHIVTGKIVCYIVTATVGLECFPRKRNLRALFTFVAKSFVNFTLFVAESFIDFALFVARSFFYFTLFVVESFVNFALFVVGSSTNFALSRQKEQLCTLFCWLCTLCGKELCRLCTLTPKGANPHSFLSTLHSMAESSADFALSHRREKLCTLFCRLRTLCGRELCRLCTLCGRELYQLCTLCGKDLCRLRTLTLKGATSHSLW